MFGGISQFVTFIGQNACCEPVRSSVVSSAPDSNTVNATQTKYYAKQSHQSKTQVQSPTKQVQSRTIAVDQEEETLNELLKKIPVSWSSLNQLKLYEEVKDIKETQLVNVCKKIRDLKILKEFFKKNCQSLKNYQGLLLQIEQFKIQLAIVSLPNLVGAVKFINNTKGEIAKFLNTSITELDKQLKLFATNYTESTLTDEIQYITKLRHYIIQIHTKEIARLDW